MKKDAKIRTLDLSLAWQSKKPEFYLRLLQLARSTEPADRQLMEAKVRQLYKALGRGEPYICWCDSPLQLFVIPYLIDRFGQNGEAGSAQVWAQAQEKYFPLLAPGIVQYLNLESMQNRLAALPFADAHGYHPLDAVIDMSNLLNSQSAELAEMVSWNVGPENSRVRYPWDVAALANVYDAINNRLWTEINRPPMLEDARAAATGAPPAWFRGYTREWPEVARNGQSLTALVEQYLSSGPRYPQQEKTAIGHERWSWFLPRFQERDTGLRKNRM
jgi:hypothetical protein